MNVIVKKIRYLNQINRWGNQKIIEILVESTANDVIHGGLLSNFFFTHYGYSLEIKASSPVELLGKLILLLQQIAGCDVHHSYTKNILEHPELHYVLIPYEEDSVAERSIEIASEFMNNFESNDIPTQLILCKKTG